MAGDAEVMEMSGHGQRISEYHFAVELEPLPISDAALVTWLQWALPQLGLRWPGFRRVRRQVKKRLRRRLSELSLSDLVAYRHWLERDVNEWIVLDGLCRISISRFYRDRAVFSALAHDVLPSLAERAASRGACQVAAWSAGCASGEEPYSLVIAWLHGAAERFREIELEVTGTDASGVHLERARQGLYPSGCVRELPETWRNEAFEPRDDQLELHESVRNRVRFEQQDIRRQQPAGPFDLVLCRNLALTYFDQSHQVEVMARIDERMVPGALLVVGSHEQPPPPWDAWPRWVPQLPIYVKPT